MHAARIQIQLHKLREVKWAIIHLQSIVKAVSEMLTMDDMKRAHCTIDGVCMQMRMHAALRYLTEGSSHTLYTKQNSTSIGESKVGQFWFV